MKTRQLLFSSFGRETVWIFLFRITSTGMGFLATVLLARVLGADGYGVYSYALALVMLLSLPAQSGLPVLLMRETAKNSELGRYELVRGVWVWAGRAAGILSVGLLIVGGSIVVAISEFPLETRPLTTLWAFLLVPLIALGNLRGAALQGLDRIVEGQLPEYVLRPTLLVVLLGGLALLHDQMTSSQAMAMHVVAATVAFAVGAYLLWKRTPGEVRRSKPRFEARAWLASALPLALITGMMTVNGYADILILGLFEAPDQVGVYRVAVQFAALVSFGLQAVNMVVAPRFARLYAQKQMGRLQTIVTSSARLVLAISLALALLFVAFGESVLELVFGSAFGAAYVPLLILIGGHLVNSVAGSVGYLLNMTGHERDEARAVTVAAAVNIVLNFALIPQLGTVGAATATALSFALWRFWLWRLVRQRLDIDSLAFGTRKRGSN